MKYPQLKLKSTIDINEFCDGWIINDNGFTLRIPIKDEFVYIDKTTRVISNRGFITTIQRWILDGHASFSE